MRIGAVNPGSYPPPRHIQTTATAKAVPEERNVPLDRLELSSQEQAKEALKQRQEALKQKQQEAEAHVRELREQLEASNAQTKAMQDSVKTQSKCFTIASRIMAGDEVPREDLHYLAKNSPELYGRALTLRIAREDPRKYKRLSEEEVPDNPLAQLGGQAAEPPQVEAGGEAGDAGGAEDGEPTPEGE